MKPELFIQAQNLWRRIGAAGEAAWERAIAAPTAPERHRKILTIFGIAFLAVLAVIFTISHMGAGEVPVDEADTHQAVTVTPIALHSFNSVIEINGQARPERDIQVTAPATGVRILELMVDEGQEVRAGQPMARLDTALAQAQTRAAEASVAEARSASVRARGEYQRAESIRSSGALSTEAIEARHAAAIAADARLAAAQAQLAEVNARLGGGYVRAPAAGLVIDRTAEVGRAVDGQVLFRIAAGDALEVAAQVAESDMLALQEGQSAIFELVDGSKVTARLSRLPASIDPQTRTGEALFALPRGSRVRAGMFLRGAAQLAPRNALAVPQSSVLYESGDPYLYIVGAENHATRTPVTLGVRDGDLVEVTSGAAAGDRVVGAGAAFLQNGDVVRPIAATTTTTAPNAAPAQQQQQNAPSGNDLRGREG